MKLEKKVLRSIIKWFKNQYIENGEYFNEYLGNATIDGHYDLEELSKAVVSVFNSEEKNNDKKSKEI